MHGQLERDGEVLFADLEIDLEQSRTNSKQWRGRFEIPQASDLDPEQLYHLVLDDGQAGDIVITARTGTAVRFRGSGLLG